MRTAARALLLGVTALLTPPAAHAALDRSHAAWTGLLAKHVQLADPRGMASRVDYAGFARDRAALRSYLGQLARVTPAELAALPRGDQIAFWINAYNAATVELILTEYPRHGSIKDYGSLFRSAWQRPFVRLLGETLTLDQIEHERLRGERGYAEPRVHFAVNCASISCPMLREEAYVGAHLDAQLEEQAHRFLSDRSRNRFDRQSRALSLSPIFDWYRGDFSGGDLPRFLGRPRALRPGARRGAPLARRRRDRLPRLRLAPQRREGPLESVGERSKRGSLRPPGGSMTAAASNANHHEGRRQTLFLILAGVFIGNALLAELIGGKLFQVPTPWHTFTLSCGIVLWPVVFVFTDIINEYFGREGVRKMSFLAAAIIAYSFLALTLAGSVPAASFSPVDDASFSRVFTQSQWIIVGSIFAFLLAQLIDVSVFWIIRRSTGHRFLWLRATGSTLVSQLIDTFVVGFIGLHLPTYFGRTGPDFAEFVNAALSGYLFKFLIALSTTPALYVLHKIVDGYLGKTDAEKLIEAVALTERADDAHLRVEP